MRSPTDSNEVQRSRVVRPTESKNLHFNQFLIPSNIKKTFVCD